MSQAQLIAKGLLDANNRNELFIRRHKEVDGLGHHGLVSVPYLTQIIEPMLPHTNPIKPKSGHRRMVMQIIIDGAVEHMTEVDIREGEVSGLDFGEDAVSPILQYEGYEKGDDGIWRMPDEDLEY